MAEQIIDNSVTGIRSKHNMPFNWLGSADFGRIIPFHWQELIGTDKVITCKPRIEMQMLPLVSPTFGKLDLYVHYFFVPTRLLWSDFLDFYSSSGAGQSSTPPFWSKKDFYNAYRGEGNEAKRALFKHWTSMGLPPFWMSSLYDAVGADAKHISLLPFRAYNQIWWDFYRDPELISDASKSQYLNTAGGRQGTTLFDSGMYSPKLRMIQDNWISNLFASNGTDAGPLGAVNIGTELNPALDYITGLTSAQVPSVNVQQGKVYNRGTVQNPDSLPPSNANDIIGEVDSRTLRTMEALTRMAERLSLGGKRQIDRLFAQYGIKPQYSKLNMCQYVGGAKSTVMVSDITSSADTTQGADTEQGSGLVYGAPLGQKAGAGYCAFNELNIEYTASEPGYLMGVFSVMPHVHFIQGIGKQWYKNRKEDWFTKQLEHVGQVAVPKEEVGVLRGSDYSPAIAKDDETFAFTQPYYEYKRNVDILAGDFMKYFTQGADPRDKDIAYMNSMGLYADYPSTRDYNAQNMQVDAMPYNKIFFYLGGNVFTDSDDHFHLNISVDLTMDRPMDGYAVPSLETTENPHQSKQNIGADVTL